MGIYGLTEQVKLMQKGRLWYLVYSDGSISSHGYNKTKAVEHQKRIAIDGIGYS